MNCRKVNHLLSAYMDSELPGVEHRQIHEHLLRCGECLSEYEALLRMKRTLGSMQIRQPRTDLQAKILYHIEWHAANEEQWRPGSWLGRITDRMTAAFGDSQGRGLVVALGALVLVAAVRVTAGVTTQRPSDTIVWSPAPPPLSTLTAGLGPSESTRFLPRPANYSWYEPMQTRPVSDAFTIQPPSFRRVSPPQFNLMNVRLDH